jgi:rhodanese-related sulfurtransferase
LPPDLAWFYVGRVKGGPVLGFLCRLSLEPDSCVRSTENLFHQYGARALLVAKFIPGFSTVAPPLAGIVGMRAATFVFYDTAGALLWAGLCAGVGALFSNQLEQLVGLFDQAGGLLLAIVALGFAGFVAYKFFHRQKFLRDLRMAKISVDELKQRLDAGEPLTIVDVRHPISLELDPDAIPGALNLMLEEIEHRHHEIPRDRDIVLYCTCPNEVSSARTALLLKKKGIHRVRPLEGGLDAWRDRKFPIERRPNKSG